MNNKKSIFNPLHLKCKLCGDIIYSKYEGQYVACSCKAIAVDQTIEYSRYLGRPENFIKLEKNYG